MNFISTDHQFVNTTKMQMYSSRLVEGTRNRGKPIQKHLVNKIVIVKKEGMTKSVFETFR